LVNKITLIIFGYVHIFRCMKRTRPFVILLTIALLSCYIGGIGQNLPDKVPVRLDSKIIVAGLDVPWELTWGPDNWIWFTEQGGNLSKVNPETGKKKLLLSLPEVYRFRSLGMLGMAVHPDPKKPYVFIDYTYKTGKTIASRLVRYTYTADTLISPVVLLNDIPGNTGHNGSRVVIAPDGKLMLSTGDAVKGANAQDLSSINGKVLRLNIDGTIPADNPYPGSPIWSMGHRNAQGLTFDKRGTLFNSEHGDAIEDELNIIKKAANYGWPSIEGFCDTEKEKTFATSTTVTSPLKSWTPVIAPAAIAYYDSPAIPEWKNSLLLVTLKTQSLRMLKLNDEGNTVIDEQLYLDHQFGRLRGVCVSPAGDVYVSTSNRDWNPGDGYPKKDDDSIIKIFKARAGTDLPLVKKIVKPPVSPGALLYNNYCASCHKNDGKGMAGVFPTLRGTPQVMGDKTALIHILLKGLSGPLIIKGQKYDQEMPAFSFLSNKEVAQVASYIRTQFGNSATIVTEVEVARARSAKVSRR
jgi:glucose/arabinose dehydrogenase